MLTVALGSLALSFIGSIGAALTLGARRSGVLLAILILPLAAPILIFGRSATEVAIRGEALMLPPWNCWGRSWSCPSLSPRWPRRPPYASVWSRRNVTWTWFHRLGSPPYVYRLAGRLTPWFAWRAGVLILAGLFGGLVLAPPDYQQGDGFRIIYVHAPTAWLSLMVYTWMGWRRPWGSSGASRWRMRVAAACAPMGASFTAVALATGSLLGKPMWGTWWVWTRA